MDGIDTQLPEVAEPAGEEGAAAPIETLATAARARAAAPRGKEQKVRVRVLGVPLPASVVSWTASIAVHALLLTGILYVYRHYRDRAAAPVISAGNGSENRGGLLWHDGSPGGGGLPDAPETGDAPASGYKSMSRVMAKLDRDAAEDDPVIDARPPQEIGPQPDVSDENVGVSDDLSRAPRLRKEVGPGKVGVPSNATGASARDSATIAGVGAAHRGNGQGAGAGQHAGNGKGGGRPGIPAGVVGGSLPGPVYPEESRSRGEEGTVKIAVEVLANGSVGSISVVAAPPYPRLTEAAVDAVKQTRFSPAIAEGTAVRSVIVIPFQFTLR